MGEYLERGLWPLFAQLSYALQGTYSGRVLANFWELLTQLWYFVPLGALISALARHYQPRPWLRTALERHAHSSIFAAVLLGLLSPLCTFAAIPVVGSLLAGGVPAAPLIGFMVASPLMNPALFFYTSGIIGAEMAIARTLTALATGLLAAYACRQAMASRLLRFDGLALERVPAELLASSDRRLGRRFLSELSFISRYFALGLAVAALSQTFLSEDLVLSLVGPGSTFAVPVAAALGVPLYTCGGASLPVVETMLRIGMSSGAALAFFIAGPASKFSTLAILAAVFGRRLLAFYLCIAFSSALFWGYCYPFVAPATATP